ncbi:ABC transporter substrate-binding protein [Desulfotalea psychrophila]|uniref:Thiamine pyrimidine synthase n=1 Tax=Desulfotalea psychrophila (strain LSv54 / DSM 12343) TaxID=177439 RepID=Q6AND9_DESPS|nr:ABC transporter substrate-binding protein [Desulfotalea psychrophila]CAG36135.1 hypothetical protein DP1406 [Desulfotalea psychrophila LSv54]
MEQNRNPLVHIYRVATEIFFIALLICFSAALSLAAKHVRLALQWYPQAQFAGYYMAHEKGIYASHGLEVEILPGSANMNGCEKVRLGKAEFATAFLSDALQLRSQGVPLVNVGQFVQRSALMLVARKDSGIKTIHDLDGARIGTWGEDFCLQPKALFKREGLNVTLVRQSQSFELFMRGGIDVGLAMWYNEYHRLLSYGLNEDEMTIFFFSDLEMNLPEDGIYSLESTFNESPETAQTLVEATAEGWLYAFAHPEETVDTMLRIMKESKVKANRAHQTWMLDRMKDLLLVKGQKQLKTILKESDFIRTQEVLRFPGGKQSELIYQDFYKGDLQ